jgi:hypothetical protein
MPKNRRFRSRITPRRPGAETIVSDTEPIPSAERSGGSLRRLLIQIAVFMPLGASPFLLLAAINWSSTDAREIFLYLASCFALAGFMAAVGMELHRKYSRPPTSLASRSCQNRGMHWRG